MVKGFFRRERFLQRLRPVVEPRQYVAVTIYFHRVAKDIIETVLQKKYIALV